MPSNHPRIGRAAFVSIVLAVTAGAALAVVASPATQQSGAQGSGVAEPASAGMDASGRFGNEAIAATWAYSGGTLAHLVVADERHHAPIEITDPFSLTFKDGSTLATTDFRLQGGLHTVTLPVNAKASRLSERIPGTAVEGRFLDPNGHIRIDWKLVQREGSDYLREVITITALDQAAPITKVSLFGADAPDAYVAGVVDGSPVVSHDDWLSFEHPMAKADAWRGKVKMWIDRTLPLPKGQSVTYSAVIGVAHAGQLRRDFGNYIERERAHPYRTFLHYNSWYDIGFFTPYTEAEALDRINTFGEQLVKKRHVQLDSFLFDDGWDDYSGSWHFSKAFPDGFVPLCKAAKKYGAAPGVWLSPWGGYGKPHAERIANGRKLGYEIVDNGLALSGPKYWQRFHAVVMTLLDKDCINQFKFDGTGNVNSVYPGSTFDSDFAAAIQLIGDIRADKPDTLINLTTGTWASPFWLKYADSIWRGGYDHNFVGVGPYREQWVTYRDMQTYQNIVIKGPLFPLNSLMLHGIIYAQHAVHLDTDPGHDFANEVHSYFATGTDLQELYITPSLLTTNDWDTLADAARWSRANAGVLRDTHWIGGDPGRLDVYGWAAWSPSKAFVTLRNPDDKPRLAILDIGRQLQLPKGAARRFDVSDVWHTGGNNVPRTLDADHETTIMLQPFEVLTLQLVPSR
ncbi:MAG TPA: enterotoxin [Rhodanobacteraceae bacterium]|nr:enterotoxin [Rhodanobacteraceae bacterium]